MYTFLLMTGILFPILAGLVLLYGKQYRRRRYLAAYTAVSLLFTAAVNFLVCAFKGPEVSLGNLFPGVPVAFHVDAIGALFAVVVLICWLGAGCFSFEYMRYEQHQQRYYAFYLMVLGFLMGLCYAGNIVTYYACFEMMSFSSMLLVVHNQSKEAIKAAMKYLLYSASGAYAVVVAIFFLSPYWSALQFVPGGILDSTKAAGQEGIILIIAFVSILGFGVKAGMFPMHAWLPTAHPVAPGPASAVLSGIIVKCGVLGIIRMIYYTIGVDYLKGTWVQYVWMSLALLTVFMGSMLAYKEPLMKKRLAYSTVSQLSYILFGLACFQTEAFTGAILHVVGHAFIKCCLFLTVSAIIYMTGRKRIDEMTGIGKEMPVTTWCYTIASLGLIGIPPTAGFTSKWYLATGSLDTGMKVFSWLGPVILLISALLTAGYLLPLTIKGFFPGLHFNYVMATVKKTSWMLVVPVIILAALTVLVGLMPNGLIAYISQAAGLCL